MDSVILGSEFQVYIPLKLFNIAINSAVEDLDANLVCNCFQVKSFYQHYPWTKLISQTNVHDHEISLHSR